jgi:hypothetical protein
MKQDIKQYVAHCTVCQQAKTEHVGSPGLLQPLPIPKKAWEIVSLDFVEGLPKSSKYDTILVVIDKFSKYGHFIPLSHPYTAQTVAQLYVDNVYKLHGLLSEIDRDMIFTSALGQELLQAVDIKMNTTTAYHPETDGQTERENQCLERCLRCMAFDNPKKWRKWLTS